jgi:secondary thiamine-phosphate synthase enzyme
MLYEYTLKTGREGFYAITSQVREAVKKSGVSEGIAVIYCPHTTGAITINENADPDVVTDLIYAYNKTFPDRKEFRHAEGNSAAHLRSSCTGASETVVISDSRLLLGTWQGIYFAEFDGPRNRRFYVKIIQG